MSTTRPPPLTWLIKLRNKLWFESCSNECTHYMYDVSPLDHCLASVCTTRFTPVAMPLILKHAMSPFHIGLSYVPRCICTRDYSTVTLITHLQNQGCSSTITNSSLKILTATCTVLEMMKAMSIFDDNVSSLFS